MSASMTPRRRSIAFWLVYAGFLMGIVLFVMLLGEAGIRLFVPRSVWALCEAKDDWRPDPELGWTNISNLDVTSRDDGPEVRFHLNADGLQPADARPEKAAGTRRVMIFGDSCTVGRGVVEDERLASHLRKKLSTPAQPVEVICAGVQGYSTDQSLLLMRRLLPRYRPDLVIHLMCDNDFGGNESSVAYGLAKPRFKLTAEGALELVPTTLEEIDSHWRQPWGSGWRRWLQYSALYRYIRPALFKLRYGGGEQDWRQLNLMGAGGAQAQINMMGKADWRLFTALLRQMQAVCRENGAEFIFTEYPHVWEVWDQGISDEQRHWLHRRLQEAGSQAGASFVPTVPFFLQRRDEGPFHLLPRDPHCNGKGYEMSARLLAGHIQQHSLLSAPIPATVP